MQSYCDYLGMVGMIGKYHVSNKTGQILPFTKTVYLQSNSTGNRRAVVGREVVKKEVERG